MYCEETFVRERMRGLGELKSKVIKVGENTQATLLDDNNKIAGKITDILTNSLHSIL